MADLHDNVERKFVESFDVSDYEILTDTGWRDIARINKTVPYEVWELKTENHSLKCADTHIVFDDGLNEVFVKDLKPGNAVTTDSGDEKVVSVLDLGFSDDMYDVELADNTDHRYYMNGVLSHNSTSYNIFVLWYCMFHSAKAVMMCAQREATAVELLSRIRLAYEYIPEWIKPSVVEYNKKSIEFGNMSSIKVFATKGGGARGNTANVLILDEFSFVPPNEANEFFASVYPVISSGKNSKVIIVSTPNGAQGLYYDIWTQANLNAMDPEKNPEGWKPIRIDWFEVPGRDERWKKQQIASVGIEKWEQEFECQFTSSSFQKLIPSELTDRYRKSYNKLIESEQ